MNKRRIGTRGEDIAVFHLQKRGYEIIERNFSCKLGEIDIIAKFKEYIVFIEVKYRKDISKGYPSESVNYFKQNKIIRVAKHYVQKHKLYNSAFRFDIVEIVGNQIRVIENAF